VCSSDPALGGEVRDVDFAVLKAVTVEGLAAGADHHGIKLLTWEWFAALPHRVLPVLRRHHDRQGHGGQARRLRGLQALATEATVRRHHPKE
jgi:hypothetical protein